jgi:cardiolipin synthase
LLFIAKITGATFWYAAGWGFAWWGIVLYWIAAGFYLYQVGGVVRAARRPPTAAAA